MDEKKSTWIEALKVKIQYWLAWAAMRWAGPELIYWLDPDRWEEYMATGQGQSDARADE